MQDLGTIRLMLPEWAAACATASSSPDTARHLLNIHRDQVWYSEAAAEGEPLLDQTITISWTEPIPVNCAVLDRHNLSGAASVRYQLYLHDAEVYDTGAIAVGHIIPAGLWRAGIHKIGATWDDQLEARVAEVFLPSTYYADQVVITISDPLNTDGRLMITRIPVGCTSTLSANFNWGAEICWNNSTEQYKTVGGGMDIEPGELYRQLKLSFGFLSSTDRQHLHVNFSRCKQRPVFVSAYPAEGGGLEMLVHQLTGYIENDLKISRANVLFGATEFVITEA